MDQNAQEFHHPMVRHLHWCIFSPDLALITGYQPPKLGNQKLIEDWLLNLDSDPTPLEQYVQSHNHQLLGSYFECLWQFFFSNAPKWQLLEDHFQVHGDTTSSKPQTLGELDILANNPEGKLWHFELAVKFYLLLPQQNGDKLEHWVGPQTRDRLDIKLSKLKFKQFPFIKSPETLAALNEKGLSKDWHQGLLLKGYLFQHKSHQLTLPNAVADSALIRHWCHRNELALNLPRYSHFVVLPKHEWLGPYLGLHIDVLEYSDLISFVKDHFDHSDNKYALMIAQVKKDKDNWREVNRWMVVNDEWPEQA